MTWRRQARRASWIALIVAGALISVGLGWGCVLWAPMQSTRPLARAEATALLRAHLGDVEFSSPPTGIRHDGWGFAIVFAQDAGIPPDPPVWGRPRPATRRSSGRLGAIPSNPHEKSVEIVRAGWPLACFDGARIRRAESTDVGFIAAPPRVVAQMSVKPMRVLPLRPRWGGLAVNAAFFALLLWLIVPGPLLLRRVLRRRGGRCAFCGYDLRSLQGSACPECGRLTRPSATTSSP